MKRKVFTALSVVSLLLCVATVAAWGLSYHTKFSFAYTTFNQEGTNWRWRNGCVWVNHGYVRVDLSSFLAPSRDYEQGWGYRPGKWFWESGPAELQTDRMTPGQTLWFAGQLDMHCTDTQTLFSQVGPKVTSGTEAYFRFPLWFPFLMTSILPFLWLRRRLKRACKECGYSLTGNTSGTCPECGTRYSYTFPRPGMIVALTMLALGCILGFAGLLIRPTTTHIIDLGDVSLGADSRKFHFIWRIKGLWYGWSAPQILIGFIVIVPAGVSIVCQLIRSKRRRAVSVFPMDESGQNAPG